MLRSADMAGMVLAVSSRALLGSCKRLGIDTDAIVAAAGLDRAIIDDADGYITTDQARELWRQAYQASGDPDLALHAAESLRFGAYKVIDFLSGSAATVGLAFTQLSAYFPIINSAVRLPIEERADHVDFGVACDDPAVLSRPYVEYIFAAAFLRIREATTVRFPLERVDFAFPAPPSVAEHERIFACPVRFGAERSLLRFTRATWDTPSGRADADLFGVLAEHARIVEQKVPSEPGPVREVRQAIIEQLKGGAPSLERTAKQMAMSPRTLQRRLRDHGISYADLLDTTRAGAAKTYLSDRQISVAEVAYLLGFSEQSSFTHAFKRWTGKAPGEYRKQV
jgi:AraC-like DNA-binding protein